MTNPYHPYFEFEGWLYDYVVGFANDEPDVMRRRRKDETIWYEVKEEETPKEVSEHFFGPLVHNIPASILSDIEGLDKAMDILVSFPKESSHPWVISKDEIGQISDAIADGRGAIIRLIEMINAAKDAMRFGHE